MSGKGLLIYWSGLAIGLIWDVIQVYQSWQNEILLAASIWVLLITVVGSLLSVTHEGAIQKWWMLLYFIPGYLCAFGGTASIFEIQSTLYASAGIEPMEPIIPGRSADYAAAARSHYLSMLIAPASWILGHVIPALFAAFRRNSD